VLVPELTRALRGEDHTAVAHAQSRGLELAVGLALPATLGLIVLADPIARMLFQHGAFTAADTAATARALMWLALGLPAHVLVKALSPAFFARHDTSTPLWATLKGFAVAVISALVLGRLFGAEGIAASIVLGAWSNAFSLIRRGAATFGFAIDPAARRRLPRIVAAALATGALLWLTARFLPALGGDVHGLAQAVFLMVLISGAITVYAVILALSGVIKRGEAVNAFRQNRPADLRE
jgi:putative peptidoglycan lipid II flippase